MIKHLPLLIAFPFFLASAKAQTDSAGKHPTVDTTNKFPSADAVKKALFDSLKKAAPVADTTTKPPPHKIKFKPAYVDSTAKHAVAPKHIKHAPGPLVIPHSPVKTLSDAKYNTLLKGGDFDDMALTGVLNHYPLPDSALKYKVQIGLNPGQIAKLKDIVAGLHQKKILMGGNIIKNEKMLDTLFKTKQVEDGTIIFYTNRYGLYLGEIRNAVLQACYKTETILSDAQIKKLESLEK